MAHFASELAGMTFGGTLTFALDPVTGPKIKATALLTFGFGQVSLTGTIENNFAKYELEGTGDATIFGKKVEIKVQLDDENGLQVFDPKFSTTKPVYAKPSGLVDADPNELRAALEKSSGGGTGTGDSTKPKPEPPNKAAEKPEKKDPSPLPELVQADLIKAEYPRLWAASFGFESKRGNLYWCWRRPDGGADMLGFAPSGTRRIAHGSVADKDSEPTIKDLTAEYSQLATTLDSGEARRFDLYQRAIARHFPMKTFPGFRATPSPIRAEAGGYVLDYLQGDEDGGQPAPDCEFFWLSNDLIQQAVLRPPYFGPEARTPALFRDLAASNTGAPGSYVVVVAHDPDSRRLSWLTQDANQCWNWTPDASEPGKKAVVQLKDVDRPYRGTGAFARANWQLKAPAPGMALVWIGPQGACAETTDGWLLLRFGDPEQAVMHVTREAFDQWTPDSRRFLPEPWQQSEFRKRLSAETVATAVIADWQRLRKSNPEWDRANPMGLLQGLARP